MILVNKQEDFQKNGEFVIKYTKKDFIRDGKNN